MTTLTEVLVVASQASAYKKDLLGALTAGVHDRLEAARAAGRDPAELGSAQDMARRMLAVVPGAHPWDEQIGPFYDTGGLTRWLGVSRQALADRVRRQRLLAVTTADGRVLYPARQFDGRGPVAGLPPVLRAFRDTPVDGWAIASWLTTPATTLNATTPLDWLRAGAESATVVELAERAAARWRE